MILNGLEILIIMFLSLAIHYLLIEGLARIVKLIKRMCNNARYTVE